MRNVFYLKATPSAQYGLMDAARSLIVGKPTSPFPELQSYFDRIATAKKNDGPSGHIADELAEYIILIYYGKWDKVDKVIDAVGKYWPGLRDHFDSRVMRYMNEADARRKKKDQQQQGMR